MERITKMTPWLMKYLGFFALFGVVVISIMGYVDPFSDPSSAASRRLLSTSCKGDLITNNVYDINEDGWAKGLRGFAYICGLIYLFLGVAISADVFMSAIEVITSKTRTVMVRGEEVEIEIWNATVANLTLMALGSSAPEILLAVVEVLALKFEAGDLGPSTIVGSASFNLLFISAICISCLPEDEEKPGYMETRMIEDMGVFGITAVASLFAYFWMVIVLEFWTKNHVSLVEGLLTFFMFPLLVLVSWCQDQNWFREPSEVAPEPDEEGGTTSGVDFGSGAHMKGVDGHKQRRGSSAAALAPLAEADKSQMEKAPEDAAQALAAAAMKKKKKSRLEYRIQATRKMTGGKRVLHSGKKPEGTTAEEGEPTEDEGPKEPEMLVGFIKATYSVLESVGQVEIIVRREGIIEKPCTVHFDTSDGTAKCGKDYIHTAGVLEFKPNEEERTISIEIIDDNEWDPDTNFFVRLFNPSETINRLSMATTQVIILNDDDPGKIAFESITVHAVDTEECVALKLRRKDGVDGNVLAFVRTVDGTALAGKDFEALGTGNAGEDFEVHFEDKQEEADVTIKLLKTEAGFNGTFSVEITAVEPEGASVGELNMCTVIISNDKNYQKLMENVVKMMDEEMDKFHVGSSSWSEQFHDAMNMGGDDGMEPEWSDYLLHFCSFYWKVLHAVIPPTDYYGGWGTFWISLFFIGGITVLVGDVAKMLGCVIGLKDSVTAITFVALGTSLPDTFASKEATVSDDNADAAITNVTGSNSVNVFLGLGLPWTFAAIYHVIEDTKSPEANPPSGCDSGCMYYPSGGLVFSVLVFFAFACVCLALLVYRHYGGNEGELGGHIGFAYTCSTVLAGFWFAYILLSSLRDYGNI